MHYFIEKDIIIVRSNYCDYVSKYTISASEFKLFNIESDTLKSKFKRSKEEQVIFDLLNDKKFITDLPIGKGKIDRFQNNDRVTFFVYLKYIDGKLTANYNDRIIPLDSNFYLEALKEGVLLPSDEKNYIRHFIVADRNIKMKDILFLEEQLKFAGYRRISYLLKSSEYDEVNRLHMLMHPLEKPIRDEYRNKRNKYFKQRDSIKKSTYKLSENKGLEVVFPDYVDYEEIEIFEIAYPTFNKENTILLQVDKESVLFNNKIISRSELKELLKKKLLVNPITQVFYYVEDDAKYQDFINVLGDVKNTIIKLRTQYLQLEYKLKYDEYFDENKRELVKESKEKYPFIFWQIDLKEYKSYINEI
ncbi:MAG: hypothetical protein QM478_02785 [Flavobacteriaceae bacterium]